MSGGIIINGGNKVTGDIHVAGSKNSGLALMAAALLATGTILLDGMPSVSDIRNMGRILQCLGTDVSRVDDALRIVTTNAKYHSVPEGLSGSIRASILLLGPLVGRFGRAKLSLPGGCTIGERPIEEHTRGLEKLGAHVIVTNQYIEVHASQLYGTTIYMQTLSVTGTMNLIMAACLARGMTQIHNAAREPEVADLTKFLTSMGVQINGLGTGHLAIAGRHELFISMPVSSHVRQNGGGYIFDSRRNSWRSSHCASLRTPTSDYVDQEATGYWCYYRYLR
jgi:UDP-N-acetylglucosamine 1-carboxyvinyltransferase